MKRLSILSLIWFLTISMAVAVAQTYVGPGPETACDGTQLRIVRKHGRVSLIHYTLYLSTRTIIEQFKPLKNNQWQVTLLLYSSRHHYKETLTNDRLLRRVTFRSSDVKKATRINKLFGYGDVTWKDEPGRLLKYFNENHEWFTEASTK